MPRKFVNNQDAVIPTYFQRVLLKMLMGRGIEAERLLQNLVLTPEQFCKDDCRISFAQNRQFIKNALDASGDPHLGWRFGKQIQVTALGMLGYAIMSSDNVASAIATLTRFFKIRDPSYDLSLVDDPAAPDSSILQVSESYDFEETRYFMLSVVISAFDHLFEFLTQEPSIIRRVEVTCQEPSQWSHQARQLNFPIVFDASSTRLYLDANFLNRAMPGADPGTEKTATEICLQMLGSVEHQVGITKEVQEFILKRSEAFPSLSETADHLCLSPRTLRRELQKSETTFQQLLDSVRASIAKELLLNTTKSVSEIAYELGYNDTSNFNRAFKAWTGSSPGRFRH